MTDDQVLELLDSGHQVDVVVQRSGWSKWDVTQLATEQGYTFSPDGCPSRTGKPKPARKKQSGLVMAAMQ